jgi:hypothetical protein
LIPAGPQHPPTTLLRDARSGARRQPSYPAQFLLQRNLTFPRSDNPGQGSVSLSSLQTCHLTPTTNQMRFNPNLDELIPSSHLDADFGGEFHYEFEPNSYWEQIVSYVFIFQQERMSRLIIYTVVLVGSRLMVHAWRKQTMINLARLPPHRAVLRRPLLPSLPHREHIHLSAHCLIICFYRTETVNTTPTTSAIEDKLKDLSLSISTTVEPQSAPPAIS